MFKSIKNKIPFEVSNSTMEEISREIKEIFPNEPKDVYFTPARDGNNPTGKLLRFREQLKRTNKLFTLFAELNQSL